jgi:sphingomyelin phosphodiesterase acid-like 3
MSMNQGISMKRILANRILGAAARQRIAPLCILLLAGAALAQEIHPAPQPSSAAVPALMLSDIHFEPFFDPAKVPQLAAAPVTEWKAILAAPSSPDQQQRFSALQQTCHVRGVDTSFALFDSSMKAMRSHAASAKFVTVSGDLISHAFDCKYKAIFPKSIPDDYRQFVEKTLDYVIGELYNTFPETPVYIALGNNDSDCGDYRIDAHSEFLRVTGAEVTKNFPAAERQAAADSFAAGGYYRVALPAPIENARLLVLNDLFMSKNYTTCANKPDPAAAEAQITWLRQQLTEARASKQKIWIMGHIPPGVDLYSTMKGMGDVCGGQQPAMFLSSEKMADELTEFSDVVELAIFAHTHMDEVRLLKAEIPNLDPAVPGKITVEAKGFVAEPKAVPVKMVSSISPNHGNNPSITLAQIDPARAALVDYRVVTASNQTGVDAKWSEEYDFARSYHEAGFSSSSVSRLIAGFAADSSAKTKASQSYIDDFSPGSPSLVLQMFWPQYVCTLSNHTAQAFKACVCPTPH